MKAFVLVLLCALPAAGAERARRIDYLVDGKTGQVRVTQRPVAMRIVALWRFRGGRWQRVRARTNNLHGEPFVVTVTPELSLSTFVDDRPLPPALYYVVAQVDGATETQLLYVAREQCQDVMIGRAHDGLIPFCVPSDDGSMPTAQFIPDPALLPR